jgi:hypothetical protein
VRARAKRARSELRRRSLGVFTVGIGVVINFTLGWTRFDANLFTW